MKPGIAEARGSKPCAECMGGVTEPDTGRRWFWSGLTWEQCLDCDGGEVDDDDADE